MTEVTQKVCSRPKPTWYLARVLDEMSLGCMGARATRGGSRLFCAPLAWTVPGWQVVEDVRLRGRAMCLGQSPVLGQEMCPDWWNP